MNFDFSSVKKDDLMRAEINGNAIIMNKSANRRLLSAPRALVGIVKQHSDSSIMLVYDSKRPLFPPKNGSILAEITITIEDMPFVNKLELAIKPKVKAAVIHNAVAVNDAAETVSAGKPIQNQIFTTADSLGGVTKEQPTGIFGRLKLWYAKLMR